MRRCFNNLWAEGGHVPVLVPPHQAAQNPWWGSMKTKRCSRCKQEKHVALFCKNRAQHDGLENYCKSCRRITRKKGRRQVTVIEKWCSGCKEIKLSDKFHKGNDSGGLSNICKICKSKRAKDYRIKNNKSLNNRDSIRALSDKKFRISRNIRCAISTSICDKHRRSWEGLVGYGVDELLHHMEKLFQPGMTWENYGKYGWHIDHKIPVAAFNFTSTNDPDFKRCWALNNLQPLWANENLSKNSRLIHPFQPSLAFGA